MVEGEVKGKHISLIYFKSNLRERLFKYLQLVKGLHD